MYNQFTFFPSYWEAIEDLPREIQGEVLLAIIEYGVTGKTTESLKPIANALFKAMRPNIDMSIARRNAGKAGGAPKGSHNNPCGRCGENAETKQELSKREAKTNQNKAKEKEKENEKESTPLLPLLKEKEKEKEKESSRMLPHPTPNAAASGAVVAAAKGKDIVNDIVAYYNEQIAAHGARLRRCASVNQEREGWILARLDEYSHEMVRTVIDKAVASRALNYDLRIAPVDIGWIMRPRNFLEISEGKYDTNTPQRYGQQEQQQQQAQQQREERSYDRLRAILAANKLAGE